MNLNKLMNYCDLPTADFWQKYPTYGNQLGKHAFVDNGAKVLGVAHLDTVEDFDPENRTPARQAGQHRVVSAALDDRLGAYILLEALPELGLKLDWLLTDNEERCQSTARDFEPPKAYNWVIEFDRHGTGVVMYQYHSEEWRKPLAAVGMDLEFGSYSDISDLERLGVLCFNWGCGYRNEHTDRCHAHLGIVERQVQRFVAFYEQYHDQALPFVPEVEDGNEAVWQEIADAEDALHYGEPLTKRQLLLLDLLGWEVSETAATATTEGLDQWPELS